MWRSFIVSQVLWCLMVSFFEALFSVLVTYSGQSMSIFAQLVLALTAVYMPTVGFLSSYHVRRRFKKNEHYLLFNTVRRSLHLKLVSYAVVFPVAGLVGGLRALAGLYV